MDGKRQPSKNPRRIRVTMSEGKPWIKPVHIHTIPQQNAIVGITRLNCRRLTRMDEGNLGPAVSNYSERSSLGDVSSEHTSARI